jgi:O-antigen/teichoic acid export membrane protein
MGLAAWIVAKQLDFPDTSDADEGFRAVLREFWRYCLPLVPYTWLGFVYEFADRWLLQNHGGSIEQAFYSVGQQFGAVAALATASVMNVFWKEIAEAHHRDNLERVAMLYRKVSRGLFFIAAAIAGFLVPWAAEILRIVLGPAYVGGATALAVMLLYPLHQSMGQIGGTMMYATGHVRAQVIIGMAFMATSIVVTYFVLAPVDATIPGFSLGSAGLAAKMVILQILSVNAVAFYLARSLQVRFDWTYQLVGSVVCLMAGWLAHIAAWSWFDMSVLAGVAMGMLIAACLYVFLLCAVIWSMPALAGLERDEIAGLIRRVRGVGFRRNAR